MGAPKHCVEAETGFVGTVDLMQLLLNGLLRWGVLPQEQSLLGP